MYKNALYTEIMKPKFWSIFLTRSNGFLCEHSVKIAADMHMQNYTEIPKLSDPTNCANVDPVCYSSIIRVVRGTVAARLVTHGTRDITPIFLYSQTLSDLEGMKAVMPYHAEIWYNFSVFVTQG